MHKSSLPISFHSIKSITSFDYDEFGKKEYLSLGYINAPELLASLLFLSETSQTRILPSIPAEYKYSVISSQLPVILDIYAGVTAQIVLVCLISDFLFIIILKYF
jgi:hypothetical protein